MTTMNARTRPTGWHDFAGVHSSPSNTPKFSLGRWILFSIMFSSFFYPIWSIPLQTVRGESETVVESQLPPTLFPISIKASETTLALLSALLVTVTYAILIRAGARMASSTKLPLKSIQENIGTLLSACWPDTSATWEIVAETRVPDTIRLLYTGRMQGDDDPTRRTARGVLQCKAEPHANRDVKPLWLTSGSPLTKSIVQLAVWEWLSIWLVLITVCATAMYNGFFSGSLGPDSYARLTVVLIYGIAFIVHAAYVWRTCSQFFTMVAAGATWSMLERANFAIVDLDQYKRRLTHPADPGSKLDFSRISKASAESKDSTYDAIPVDELEPGARHVHTGAALDEDTSERLKEIRDAVATMDKISADERTNATSAAQAAFDNVVSNALMNLAVVVSTGFASWTARLSKVDSTQLGSLALLASLGIGVAAMFSSAVQLNVLNSSYEQIVSLKEIKINKQAREHCRKLPSKKVWLGFTLDTVEPRRVMMRDVVAGTETVWQKMCLLVFGPAYALLPTPEDHKRVSKDVHFVLETKVREATVVMTTKGTDNHASNEDGNIESINVCYRPTASTRPVATLTGRTKSRIAEKRT